MLSFITRITFAVGASTLAGSVLAADPAATSGAAARYQQERAACLGGQTHQDRETCLQEAGAALQQARSGRAEDAASDVAKNRLSRCEVHPPQDRAECERRMNDGSTSGSVGGGGVTRELVTREPARPN